MEDDSRPPFLDLLDSDPDRAFDMFYRHAVAVLTVTPPRIMRGLGPEDFKDALHDIILHCIENKFRVLRKYTPGKSSFDAWLYVVAHNKCRDLFRNTKSRPDFVSINGSPEGRSLEEMLPDPRDGGEVRPELTEAIRLIGKLMDQMGERGRMLLELAAYGWKPDEMVVILRLPHDQNKKVSDDLRYCREKLNNLLRDRGIDIASLIGSKKMK